MTQVLITDEQMAKLRENGEHTAKTGEGNFTPVLKLFTPDANATWLITDIADDGDTMFGLCDLGMGMPEVGYVSLTEIKGLRGKLGLPVERDEHITFDKPLEQYADAARAAGRIVT